MHIYLSDLICQRIFFTSDIIQPSDNWFNLQNGYKIWWNISTECGGNHLSMIRLRHIINNSDDFKEFIKSHFWEFERLHGWVTEIWSVYCIFCIPHLIKFWMEKFLFVFQFLFIQDIWAQLEVSRFIRKSQRLIHQTCKTEKKNLNFTGIDKMVNMERIALLVEWNIWRMNICVYIDKWWIMKLMITLAVRRHVWYYKDLSILMRNRQDLKGG